QMRQWLNFLRSLALAIEEDLNRVEIRMHPHRDRLALTLIPIPVGKQMQNRFRSPPRLVIIEVVFGKAAHIDDAELRINGRPCVGRGLAAIVKSGPGETSGEP